MNIRWELLIFSILTFVLYSHQILADKRLKPLKPITPSFKPSIKGSKKLPVPVIAKSCPRIRIKSFKIIGKRIPAAHRLYKVRIQAIIENYGDDYHGLIGTVYIERRGANVSIRELPGPSGKRYQIVNLGHNKRMSVGFLTVPLGDGLQLSNPRDRLPGYHIRFQFNQKTRFDLHCNYTTAEKIPVYRSITPHDLWNVLFPQ